jgi:hypothetical protein
MVVILKEQEVGPLNKFFDRLRENCTADGERPND